jgi:hypothetical protein
MDALKHLAAYTSSVSNGKVDKVGGGGGRGAVAFGLSQGGREGCG